MTIAIMGNVIWYYFSNRNGIAVDFESAPTIHVSITDLKESEAFPYFNEEKDSWIKEGVVVSDIASLAVDSDPQGVGPDGIGHFILIQITPAANASTYVVSIKELAAAGIYHVGVYQAEGPPTASETVEIEMFQIVAVKHELTGLHNCRDRFSF